MDEDEECNFFTKQTAGVSSTTKDRTVAEDDNRTGLRSQGDDDKGGYFIILPSWIHCYHFNVLVVECHD